MRARHRARSVAGMPITSIDTPRRRLLDGLPVRERRVVAGGVATALLEGGDGPPLLLLHGGIECGGVYWAPVLARLAEQHRIVVPDAPGLGESAPVAELDDARVRALAPRADRPDLRRAAGAGGALAVRHAGRALRRRPLRRPRAPARLRRPRRGPLPDAARPPRRRGPLRPPPDRAQRGALRALRAARPRADPPARAGVVRRVQRLRAGVRARPARQADDERADPEPGRGRSRTSSCGASASPPPCCGGATTG